MRLIIKSCLRSIFHYFMPGCAQRTLLCVLLGIGTSSFPLYVSAQEYNAPDYVKYYNINGSTVDELMNSIKKSSVSVGGAFGYTKINTKMAWESKKKWNGECSIGTVDFSYTITIFMPYWTNKFTAKNCLQQNWDDVWHKILIHEETHRSLYQRLNATEIKQQLEKLPAQRSCNILNDSVHDAVDQILKDNDKLHDAFHQRDIPPVLRAC